MALSLLHSPTLTSTHDHRKNHSLDYMGIVNGTTNYILTRMTAEGAEYEDVLKDAQRLGLAEPDPTADVEGYPPASAMQPPSCSSSPVPRATQKPTHHLYFAKSFPLTPEI